MLMLTAIIAVSACNNNEKKMTADSGILPNGITMMPMDSLTLTAIQDNKDDKRMPNSLFYGKNDADSIKFCRQKAACRLQSAASSWRKTAKWLYSTPETAWTKADS